MEVNEILQVFKNKLANSDNKDLAKNTVALAILNFFNFILPLLTIPVLLNNLGANAYGIVNIYISLFAIFQKIVNYGFDYIGTKIISVHKEQTKRNEIFSTITFCKSINAVAIILIAILYFVVTQSKNTVVAFIISVELFGTALNVNWLFQGLKKMSVITLISSVTKIIYSILILFLIKKPSDLYLYAILYSSISIGIGLASIVYSFTKRFSFRFVKVSIRQIFEMYKEGWHMFVASLCSGLSTNLCTVILGSLKGEIAVAYFSAGYKIVQAIGLVFSAITQAIYPFSCSRFTKSFSAGKQYVFKLMKYILIVIGVFCLVICVSSKNIYTLIYSEDYWKYYPVAIIGSVWMYFSFQNNFLGIQIIVASNHSSLYRKKFVIATILTIALYYVLIPILDSYGAMLALLTGEVFLSVVLYKAINRIENESNLYC